jgi:hypothetical protein
MNEFGRVIGALSDISGEFRKATEAHGKFNSAHEGYAVLAEELDELWAEVKRKDRDMAAMRKEAVQVGAMALRFLVDVCGEVEA